MCTTGTTWSDDRTLLVLYGTETGTAQDLAEQLWRECKRRGVSARVTSFDDYNLNDLPHESFFVTIVSTSGQGEVPSAMRSNWRKLLNARIPKTWLSSCRFLSFGLGDSSYKKYNLAAKKLYRRLLQLGADPVVDQVHCGDDQHELGPYGAFNEFMERLWEELEASGMFQSFRQDPTSSYPSKFDVVLDGTVPSASEKDENAYVESESITDHDFVNVPCTSNARVTSEDHFQETRLITFACSLPYEPGDVLMIQPANVKDSVKIILEACQIDTNLLEQKFKLVPTEKTIKLPPTWLLGEHPTLRSCIEAYFDLQQVPKLSFFGTLSRFSSDSLEKERLEELSDPKNLDEYLDYCQRPRRTIAETLRDFPATSKTLFGSGLRPEEAIQRAFELFSVIRPRAFSIASSPTAHSGQIQVLVAKVSYKSLIMHERRQGLCSTFLANLRPGDKVFVKLRKGTFRFPHPSSARILVGPGTGIAPFRSLCAELSVKSKDEELTVSESRVYFGCRHPEKDFYFAEEWSSFDKCVFHTAFSRPHGKEDKKYVQDHIQEHSKDVWDLIAERNAHIYVAGRAKDMPDAVTSAIKGAAQLHGAVEDPEAFLNTLERTGRLQFETWE